MHCSRRHILQTLIFSLSYLHRQMSPPDTLVVKGGTIWARNGRWILPENVRLPRNIQGFLHAVNLRHGINVFISLPKEDVLRIFSPWKFRRLRPGLNPFRFCKSGFDCVFRVWFRDWGFPLLSYFLQTDDEKVHRDRIASLYAIINYPSNSRCKSYAVQQASFNNLSYSYTKGYAVAQLVEALRYKPEGCGFDSRWCYWNFSLT